MSTQFYLDGYRPGHPRVESAHPSAQVRPAERPDEVDVLIVGCGPDGLGRSVADDAQRRNLRPGRASASR